MGKHITYIRGLPIRQTSVDDGLVSNTRNSSILPRNCPITIDPFEQLLVPVGDAPRKTYEPITRPVATLTLVTITFH